MCTGLDPDARNMPVPFHCREADGNENGAGGFAHRFRACPQALDSSGEGPSLMHAAQPCAAKYECSTSSFMPSFMQAAKPFVAMV